MEGTVDDVFTREQYNKLIESGSNQAKILLDLICQSTIHHCQNQIIRSIENRGGPDVEAALDMLALCLKNERVDGKLEKVLKITSVKIFKSLLKEWPISIAESVALLVACRSPLIKKVSGKHKFYHGHNTKLEAQIIESLKERASKCNNFLPIGSVIYLHVLYDGFAVQLPMEIIGKEHHIWDEEFKDPTRCFVTNSLKQNPRYKNVRFREYPPPASLNYVLAATEQTKIRLQTLQGLFHAAYSKQDFHRKNVDALKLMVSAYPGEAELQGSINNAIELIEQKSRMVHCCNDVPVVDDSTVKRVNEIAVKHFNLIRKRAIPHHHLYDFSPLYIIANKCKLQSDFNEQIYVYGVNIKITGSSQSNDHGSNTKNNNTKAITADLFAITLDKVVAATNLGRTIATMIVLDVLGISFPRHIQDRCLFYEL